MRSYSRASHWHLPTGAGGRGRGTLFQCLGAPLARTQRRDQCHDGERSLGLTSHKSSCNCTGCGAPRRGLHQLRREDRGADPRVRPRRARRRPVLGRLPRGDRAVLLHPARALARAAHAMSAATSASSATWPLPRGAQPWSRAEREAHPAPLSVSYNMSRR